MADNENKMQATKNLIRRERPWMLVYDCNAHHINKLEEAVSPKDVIAQISLVQKYFRNTHVPHESLNCFNICDS